VTLLSVTGIMSAVPASADPADCVSGVTSSTEAYAECPAGAGSFEFRVVAQSGGITGLHTVYGAWQQPSSSDPVRSVVVCEGAPKCAISSPSIEVR
jgi:hypothetical protein